MARCTEIEWLFDECDSSIDSKKKFSSRDLATMTIGEELVEISAPLTHPVGATSIQIIGISAGYECLVRAHHSNGPATRLQNGDRGLSFVFMLLVVFACLCIKFRLPRYVVWLPILILGFAAWLLVEWSLFQY